MNESVIISAWVITTLLFVIILWKFILLEKYVNNLDYRIKSMESEELKKVESDDK